MPPFSYSNNPSFPHSHITSHRRGSATHRHTHQNDSWFVLSSPLPFSPSSTTSANFTLMFRTLAFVLLLTRVHAFMMRPPSSPSSSSSSSLPIRRQHQYQHHNPHQHRLPLLSTVIRAAAAEEGEGADSGGGGAGGDMEGSVGDSGDSSSSSDSNDYGGGGGEQILERPEYDTSYSSPSDTSLDDSSSSSSSFPTYTYGQHIGPDPSTAEELKARVLRQVSQLRREGPLSEVLGMVPEEALGIDFMPTSGQANILFKIYETNRDGKMKEEDKTDLLFVKYADEVLSSMDGKTLLSKGARVKPEYHGYQELARQMQNMVPRTYVADEVEGLLITEFLTDHRAFADFLKKGEVPAVVGEDSVPVQIAQLLGRYHGHSMENSKYETEEYKTVFDNQEHINFWLNQFVEPLLNTLRDPVAHITKPYLAQSLAEVLEEGEEDAAALLWAVDSLSRSYEFKKQALVHADTHAQNVMVSEKDGGVKLIDAEKSMWGPCGFDMGQWLANFAYYLAAFEGEGEVPQRLCDCMQFSWLHYEREFMRAQAARGLPAARTQDMLRSIFNDSIGYMGLWLLFLTTSNPVEVLPFDLTDTRQLQVAHANLLRMAVAALLDFKKYRSPMDLLAVPEEGKGPIQGLFINHENEPLHSHTQTHTHTPSSSFDEEIAITAWKRYETGAQTRGNNIGVSGNNMRHVVEFLRAAALPLPPPMDTHTNIQRMEEEKMRAEEVYMKNVVLPEEGGWKRADPDVFEKDRRTKEWRKVSSFYPQGEEEEKSEEKEGKGIENREKEDENKEMEVPDDALLRAILGGGTGAAAAAVSAAGVGRRDMNVNIMEEAMVREELVAGLAATAREEEEERMTEEERERKEQERREVTSFAHESGQDDIATAAAAEAAAAARARALAELKRIKEFQVAQEQGKEGAQMPPPSLTQTPIPAVAQSDNGGTLGADFDDMVKMGGLDEDVGKLRTVLKNSFPAFWKEMGEGEADGGAHGVVKFSASSAPVPDFLGVESGKKGREEGEGEGEEGNAEVEIPVKDFDAFSGPSFTPFPPEEPNARRTRPPTKRQSWTSRAGNGGEDGAPPRRKKKQ